MPITQTVYFDADVPVRGEDPIVFTTKANAAWVEMKNVINNELNPAFTQMNDLETNVNSKEASATASATSAATSATTATAKANICTAVVIPTTATYSYTQQDWRQSMMSKAEFNALAAERRANRAGSGFDEFGKHRVPTSTLVPVNEGIWTNTLIVNGFYMGDYVTPTGISKTDYATASVNGSVSAFKYLNDHTGGRAIINLPPAPTVLPHTATLTQQQIDSGVIQHADASNSGLIVNGKFDTDTSGWTAYNGATISISSGEMVVTSSTINYAQARQVITGLVIGKQYMVEWDSTLLVGVAWVLFGSTSGGAEYGTIGATSTKTRRTLTFTATTALLSINVQARNVVGDSISVDNIAVFPADAISRSDLVFLESWHEDISEKDFVYPLGNVQYLGTTGDAGTPVAGAFAGSATYSLFSDTWQADSALVGKGYVWSTLSDANKKAFVANPENNCYLDGDKVIQVRYRMRVVMGWGDTWENNVSTSGVTRLAYISTNARVKPKGKMLQLTSGDLATFSSERNSWYVSYDHSDTKADLQTAIGAFQTTIGSTSPDTVAAHDGKCFALPIALISR